MKCPICDVELLIAERHGVEIDYCPKCRGIWLDRGELDKIIERARSVYGEEHGRPEKYYEAKKRKKRSFFEDLFEFGD